MLKKAYIRYREELPDGCNLCAAADGFSRLGVKVVPFYGFGDVKSLPDLGSEACVAGFICDVNEALDTMGIPHPESLDYPHELRRFLGRNVRPGVLADVRHHPGDRVFVKPQVQKLFTGLVFDNSYGCRIRLATYPDETLVWISDTVEFISEYRVFCLDGKIVDVRRYCGDWSVAPDRSVVEDALSSWKSAPAAFALDFGMTQDGQTLLVETNDATALGHYGLNTEKYAQMIEARWLQIVTGK